MKQISLNLPKALIAWLETVPNRSEFIRQRLAADLARGLRGHRRRRHSARHTCAQTTLLVDEHSELYAQLQALAGQGERSTFAELSLSCARAEALRRQKDQGASE